jgi:hypothetical protein
VERARRRLTRRDGRRRAGGFASRTSWATNDGPSVTAIAVVAGVEPAVGPISTRADYSTDPALSHTLTLRSLFREQLHGIILRKRPPNPSRRAFAGRVRIGASPQPAPEPSWSGACVARCWVRPTILGRLAATHLARCINMPAARAQASPTRKRL